MTAPKLIGLYSPAPQSGKSTAAAHLRDAHGYEIIKFAGPLKAMVGALLREAGYDHVEKSLEGEFKTRQHEHLGNRTPRYLLQTLGTEWGRNLVARDLWTDLAISKARRAKGPVVIDDMRFPNEFEAVKAAGGITVQIVRPDVVAQGGHASEGALDGYRFDYYITNAWSLSDFCEQIDIFVGRKVPA